MGTSMRNPTAMTGAVSCGGSKSDPQKKARRRTRAECSQILLFTSLFGDREFPVPFCKAYDESARIFMGLFGYQGPNDAPIAQFSLYFPC